MNTPANIYAGLGQKLSDYGSFDNMFKYFGMPETLPVNPTLKYNPLAMGLMQASGADANKTQDRLALSILAEALTNFGATKGSELGGQGVEKLFNYINRGKNLPAIYNPPIGNVPAIYNTPTTIGDLFAASQKTKIKNLEKLMRDTGAPSMKEMAKFQGERLPVVYNKTIPNQPKIDIESFANMVSEWKARGGMKAIEDMNRVLGAE
jgi:hypothetical protein